MNKKLMTTLTLGSAMAFSAATASGAENPFAAKSLKSGYQLAEAKAGEGACGNHDEKSKEAKCGEAKCGGEMKEDKAAKDAEGKCGEGACGERKDKDGEGACGNAG